MNQILTVKTAATTSKQQITVTVTTTTIDPLKVNPGMKPGQPYKLFNFFKILASTLALILSVGPARTFLMYSRHWDLVPTGNTTFTTVRPAKGVTPLFTGTIPTS